jgi:hypothetical protein
MMQIRSHELGSDNPISARPEQRCSWIGQSRAQHSYTFRPWNGGAGLGTLGFHEAKAHELCSKAGFSSIRRVPLENPFNNLYEAKP